MKTLRRLSLLSILTLLVVFPSTATVKKETPQTPRMNCMKSCRTDYGNCMKDANTAEARAACNKAKIECDKACPN